MLSNCSVGEDLWDLLDCKAIKPVNPKGNQPWVFIGARCWRSQSSIALATWCKEPTHWKIPWCWERLKVGEGDKRGQDGWMASLTQWTWVWGHSGRWWRTGNPGVLQSMGSQSVEHDWVTEQWQLKIWPCQTCQWLLSPMGRILCFRKNYSNFFFYVCGCETIKQFCLGSNKYFSQMT